ncbi:hypothetical protein LX36DRAFT_660687 [Colletotrichum falcatum]|nr:hypothetical protein LX36DRAFT_660687 [Colletotrichum falcatum]
MRLLFPSLLASLLFPILFWWLTLCLSFVKRQTNVYTLGFCPRDRNETSERD